MIHQSLGGRWQFRQAGSEEWMPAHVPGGVHTDLMAQGCIPDPFVADNELGVQWVAESDWEYRLFFEVPPELLAEERVFLVCDGLDTLASITLNGHGVGHADNMLRAYRWDVTGLLTEDENDLGISFCSPVAYIRAQQAELPLPSPAQCIPGGAAPAQGALTVRMGLGSEAAADWHLARHPRGGVFYCAV